MAIWAIIPVRKPKRVPASLRRLLAGTPPKVDLRWFVGVVESLSQVAQVERVLVISRDSTALALARDLGVHTLQEGRASSLSKVLRRAATIARGYGARAVLIIPPGSSGLDAGTLAAMIEAAPADPALVILKASDGEVVLAAFIAPPGAVEWLPGRDGLGTLLDKARKGGVKVTILDHTAREPIPQNDQLPPKARQSLGVARDNGKDEEE
jgi:2-phospho-L-lactate guanylyltransferase